MLCIISGTTILLDGAVQNDWNIATCVLVVAFQRDIFLFWSLKNTDKYQKGVMLTKTRLFVSPHFDFQFSPGDFQTSLSDNLTNYAAKSAFQSQINKSLIVWKCIFLGMQLFIELRLSTAIKFFNLNPHISKIFHIRTPATPGLN